MALVVRSLGLILIVAVLGAVVACDGNRPNVSSQIHQAITTQEKSQTLQEYETSKDHPDVLFSTWSAEQGKEICSELLKLSTINILVFEEQIDRKENKILLKSCLPELQKRISEYYKAERKKLKFQAKVEELVPEQSAPEQPGSFRFEDDVQYRDTRSGYTAYRGDLRPKEVILTFDDGPDARYTPSILHTLKAANVKAIFFEMGVHVLAHPELTKKVAADGHSIGSHSMTHGCLAQNQMCENHNRLHHLNGGRALTMDQAIAEIKGAHQIIYNTLGWVDPFFRFPYGETSPGLRKYLDHAGIANFFWSIDSQDWKNQTPQELVRNTMAALDRAQSGIILFHDVQRKTAEALPEFLSQLYAKGYRPVVLQPRDSNARLKNGLINVGARSKAAPRLP